MKSLLSIACVLLGLVVWGNPGRAQDKNTTPGPAANVPAGVRELTFDISKSERHKKGPSIAVCTTREQLELELGKEVAKAVWGEIDSKKEVVVVLGIWDTWLRPMYDGFIIREVRAEASNMLRFKYNYNPGKDQTFLFYMGYEWSTRCKVYAIPRGAAVALE